MAETTPTQSRAFTDPIGYGARLLAFDQFAPAGGTLTGIRFGLGITVSGRLQVENLESTPVALTYDPSAQVTVFSPANDFWAQRWGTATGAGSLAAYDGSLDFAGPSGLTLDVLNTTAPTTSQYSGGTTEGAPFIGTGTVALPVTDYALNRITGPANMRVRASAAVAGEVTLAYDYTPTGGNGGGVFGSVFVTDFNSRYVFDGFEAAPRPETVTDTLTYRIDPATSGWRQSLALPRMDPASGALSQVQARLATTLAAAAAAENLGPAAASVTVWQGATLSLLRDDTNAAMLSVQPTLSRSFLLGPADGTEDFAGPGGTQDSGLAARRTQTATLDAADFTGTGSFAVTLAAPGTGTIDGPASFLADIAASAGAILEIAYTRTVEPATAAVAIANATTGTNTIDPGEAYPGVVGGLAHQFISVSPDNLGIAATTDNWFIRTGDGNDAIATKGGTNVLDGGGGSNFLTGGFGADTFFVDVRNAAADVWSTVANLGSGDAATIWGIRPSAALSWSESEGAPGATGLTLHATRPGAPMASLTLAGYTTADLTNGRLAITNAATGIDPYLHITAT